MASPVKAAKLLGINVDAVVEDAISSAIVTFVGESPYEGHHDQTIGYTVMREKFDYALVRRAEEAGADFLQGLEACGIQFSDKTHLGFGKGLIYYAGMPSEKAYSIVQRKWEFPYQGFAWNLFYPKEQSKIRIEGVNILVESVTPDEIRLRVGLWR